MRIGVMCHTSMGGSARVAIRSAIHLARRGHQVHVFALISPFFLDQPVSGLKLHTLYDSHPSSRFPSRLYTDWTNEECEKLAASILSVIDAEGLDVLHYHYAMPFAFIATEIRRKLKADSPIIVGTLHGSDVLAHAQEGATAPSLDSALYESHVLTTVSHSHAALSQRVFGSLPQLEIIPNFVDSVSSAPHKQQTTGSSPARIIHVSNFRPVKDPASAARIYLTIRRHIESELWLVGDGDEMAEVRRILTEGGANGDVHYLGRRHDVESLLKQADLMLVTSRYESFSLAALEAMSCGVPVIAPSVGGLPEVVQHNETGFLYPPGDNEEAAYLAIQLLHDPARLWRFRIAALRRAAHFCAERIIPLYEAAYRRQLS